ncbi:MAG: MBL fold metallo-hydrolase, partial [bacterium]
MDFIEKFTVGSLDTRSYLVDGEYLIDPGGFNPRLRKKIESAEVSLEALLLTHAHADHFAGIFEVRDIYPDCPVYCHEQAVEALARPEKNLSAWLGEEISFAGATALGEETFLEKEYEFEVIYTPGHSPGSISFYWPKEELLVSG